jgi:hypothetical protein
MFNHKTENMNLKEQYKDLEKKCYESFNALTALKPNIYFTEGKEVGDEQGQIDPYDLPQLEIHNSSGKVYNAFAISVDAGRIYIGEHDEPSTRRFVDIYDISDPYYKIYLIEAMEVNINVNHI